MYSRLTLKHLLLGSLLSSSVKGNMHAKEVREQLEIAGQNYGLEEEHDSLRKLSVPAELNVDFSMFQGSWYDCMHTTLMTFNGEPADKHIIEQVGCDYGNLGNITKVGNHTQTLMFDIHVLNHCWFHDLGGNGQKPCPNDRLASDSRGDGNVLVKYSYKGIGSFAETNKIEFFTDHTSIKDEDGNWKINFNRAKVENTDTMVCQTHWKGIVCDWKINEYRTSTTKKLMKTCTFKNGKCPKKKYNEKQCERNKWIWDVNAECLNVTMTTTVEDGFVYDSFGSYYLVKDTAQCDVACGTEDPASPTVSPVAEDVKVFGCYRGGQCGENGHGCCDCSIKSEQECADSGKDWTNKPIWSDGCKEICTYN